MSPARSRLRRAAAIAAAPGVLHTPRARQERAAGLLAPFARTDDMSRPTFSDRLPRPWHFPVLAFAGTWALVLASWLASNVIYHPGVGWQSYFLFKDASIYAAIAEYGYPGLTHLPPPSQYPSAAAFFPLFPLILSPLAFLSMLVTHQAIWGEIAGEVAAGGASAVALWALAGRVLGRWAADRAVLLYCAFPGAMTFTMLYSEPLAIALGAACLLAALNRKWLLSGGLGILATAEHSTMIALAGGLGIAALHAIWARREWRALAAPALTPLGMLAYFTYTWWKYGSFLTWSRVEKRYWSQRIDWGRHVLHVVTWTDPGTTKYRVFNVLLIIMFLAILGGIALMIAARLPLMLTGYSILVLLSFTLSSMGGPKPRFAMTAFGIFLGGAARLPRPLYWPVLAASAALLAITATWWPHHPVGPAP